MPFPTITYEMEFTASVWTDITADVLARQGIIERGIQDNGPLGLVASTGTLSFSLNNSVSNSGAVAGYYSPDHASVRSNFAIGRRVRVKFDDGTNPAIYKFHGKIVRISPRAGQYGERYTEVECVDYVDEFSIQKLRLLSVQTSKRNDQIVTTLVASMPVAPLTTDYSTGPDTFAYALHNDRDEKTTIMSAMQKAMQSGLDYLYVKGNATNGETLVYESRHDRIRNTTLAATFSDTMYGLELERDAGLIYNSIRIVSYPVEVDAAATTVLATLQNEITIQATATETITLRYVDPSGADTRISGIDIVDPLVADTHFRMSSVAGDGGNDLNSSFSPTLTIGANATEVAGENTDTNQAGHLNKLEIVGKGIYLFDPVEYVAEDATSITAYGERPLVFDLPNNDNPNTGKDFGDHLLAKYKDPMTSIQTLMVHGNTSAALLAAVVAVEIGDRIAVVETQTGVDSEYFVHAMRLVLQGTEFVDAEYLLSSTAGSSQFWFLGDTGLSELGDTTFLGF